MTPIEAGRLVVLDRLYRKGASPSTMAQFLLEDPNCLKYQYDDGIGARDDLSYPAKVHSLLPVISRAVNQLKKRYELDINPETSHNGLIEFIGRLDALWEQVWIDHDKAPLAVDKISALKLATDVAEKKAKALGVAIAPDMKSEGNTITIQNLGQMAILAGKPTELPPWKAAINIGQEELQIS